MLCVACLGPGAPAWKLAAAGSMGGSRLSRFLSSFTLSLRYRSPCSRSSCLSLSPFVSRLRFPSAPNSSRPRPADPNTIERARTRLNAPEHRDRTRRRIERAQRAASPDWWATLEVSTCPGQPSRLWSRFCFRVRVRVRARTRELHVIHEMHVYMRARSRARLARRIDAGK